MSSLSLSLVPISEGTCEYCSPCSDTDISVGNCKCCSSCSDTDIDEPESPLVPNVQGANFGGDNLHHSLFSGERLSEDCVLPSSCIANVLFTSLPSLFG
ncbi:hypothetical protein PanWU01x14_127450 [Parasponia andersonii]|uniref:Uncharacterized protein n=1 Tax=Parasponia andersonii TaxID=3476 RepID=A0A2P5CSE5_PARAD|nr:hypothetical protein PanWU01x14_127450 [Parasponia andersonii]